MIITMLADRFNYQAAVNEVRDEWLEELLIFLGVDVRKFEDTDSPSVVEYLYENNIDIVSYPNIGALSVELNGELVGEWAGPELKLKEDKEDGSLYYEIKVECWSLQEESIELEN